MYAAELMANPVQAQILYRCDEAENHIDSCLHPCIGLMVRLRLFDLWCIQRWGLCGGSILDHGRDLCDHPADGHHEGYSVFMSSFSSTSWSAFIAPII